MSLKIGKDNDGENPCTYETSSSSEQVLQLIQKMERLGWIDLKMKKPIPCHQEHQKKPICELLIIESNLGSDKDHSTTLITMSQLVLLIKNQLIELGGRMTISNSLMSFSHDAFPPTNSLLIRMIENPSYYPWVIQAIDRLCDETDKKNTMNIQRIVSQHTHFDLITSEYLNTIVLQIFERLEQDDSTERIIITDWAKKICKIPTDLLYTYIQKYLKGSSSTSPISGKCGYVINHGGKDGTKQLISPLYIQRKKQDIYNCLQGLQESTVLDLRWFQRFEWDVGSVVHYIRSICINKMETSSSKDDDNKDTSTFTLDAEIHMTFDSHYLIGEAIYIPRSYTRKQREKVKEYYSLHGYISYQQCHVMGIMKSRIKELLLELFPDATFSSHCCINDQHFIPQIQYHLVDCIHQRKYFDLSSFLPSEFLVDNILHQDAQRLVITAIKSHDEFNSRDIEQYGVLLITEGFAIYYSSAFIQSVELTILPLCISKIAKRRARELSSIYSTIKDYSNRSNKGDIAKSSKPRNTTGKNKVDVKGDSTSSDVVSVDDVVNEIISVDLDLREIQIRYDSSILSDQHESVSWYDLDDGKSGRLGPLQAFCKLLNRDKLFDACQVAIRTELEKIFAIGKGVSLDGLDKVSRIKRATAAFEDTPCFTTACYALQLYSKLPLAIRSGKVKCTESSLEKSLEHEFLMGPATDFTMRLTQLCLYKHDLTDLFLFTDIDSSHLCDRTDLFTDPVNLITRRFPLWSLSCSKLCGSQRDPYKLLCDVLPQGVGQALSRLWELTRSQSNDPSSSILDEFMHQVEENCLLICSIPFKLMDKKSERQILLKRINGLQSALEISSDSVEITDLMVMILYQKIMGYVVYGMSFQKELVKLLISTNKAPEEIVVKLNDIDSNTQELKTIIRELVKGGK